MKVNQELFNEKVKLAKEAADSLIDTFGKTTKAGKAFAIASLIAEKAQAVGEIVFNTIKACSKATSESPLTLGMPWTAAIIAKGAAQTATIVAQSIKTIQSINSATDTAADAGAGAGAGATAIPDTPAPAEKFQDGGLIAGRSHTNGGVPFSVAGELGFEAEGGEFIVNKKSTASYLHLLEAINSSSGIGKPQSSSKFLNGGIVTGNISANRNVTNVNIDIDKIAMKIGEQVSLANRNLPNPVVAVEDINYGQSNLASVVNGANL